MKKLLALVVAVVMVMGMSVTAFAESFSFGSQGQTVEVEGDGITVTDTDVNLTSGEAANLIGGGAAASQVAVVFNKDITAPSTPVTLSFTVNGTAAPQKLHVFHFVDGAWKIEGSGDPKTVTITVNSLSPFAVAVYTPDGAKSPKTGETNAVAIAFAVIIAAGAVAFAVAPKKSRA